MIEKPMLCQLISCHTSTQPKQMQRDWNLTRPHVQMVRSSDERSTAATPQRHRDFVSTVGGLPHLEIEETLQFHQRINYININHHKAACPGSTDIPSGPNPDHQPLKWVAPLHQKVAKANPWRLQPKMAASFHEKLELLQFQETEKSIREGMEGFHGIPASHLLSTGDSQVHHFWHHPLVWFACHCWGKHQTGNAILDACVMCFKPWYLRPWPILEFFGSFYHPS